MDDETGDGYSSPAPRGRGAGSPPLSGPNPPATRRGFLVAGSLVVVAAAGGGVALGLAGHRSRSGASQRDAPAVLAAAAAAERALIAATDAAIASSDGGNRAEFHLIRTDHAEHLAALEAAIAQAVYPARAPSGSAAATGAPGRPATPSRSALRASEQRAAGTCAKRALQLSGADAALLASIAAAEASHAELLS